MRKWQNHWYMYVTVIKIGIKFIPAHLSGIKIGHMTGYIFLHIIAKRKGKGFDKRNPNQKRHF